MNLPLILSAISTTADLLNLVGKILGIISILSFLVGVGVVISGLMKREAEPAEAKKAIIMGALIALVIPIMSVIYYALGLGGAVSTPSF